MCMPFSVHCNRTRSLAYQELEFKNFFGIYLYVQNQQATQERRLSDVFEFENHRGGGIELELQWIPILDRGSRVE